MRKLLTSLLSGLIFFFVQTSHAQISFTAPDTVCISTAVNITNVTPGASSYFWNFCAANVSVTPIGTNLGNPGFLQTPVYFDYAYENGNYYGFSTNNVPGKLLRHDFGNSLLNTPTVTDLGTVGGVIPNHTEGLQVVKNNGQWYVIIVGGDATGTANEAIVKITLGPNIANNTPSGTYWGNIGNMAYPHDLYLFQDNGNWYGLTVNTTNNTITRFDFTSDFNNVPTAVNLGNIGSLNGPTGIYAIKENGNWYAFVTNAFAPGGGTITRLDFGNSLLNTPTGTNLGNIGGLMSGVWDIHIVNSCNEKTGFVINSTNGHLIRLNFNGSILNTPTAVSYGNLGNMNFPHCLSKFFRVGADLYSFVANVNNNTFTRLRFTGCNNASTPTSTLQTPPPIVYDTPGTYNINLTTDDGLNTQASVCKQIVVVPEVTLNPIQGATICPGNPVYFTPTGTGATIFNWSPTTALSNPNIPNPVATPTTTTTYTLTVSNGHCTASQSATIQVLSQQQCAPTIVTPSFDIPDTVCVNTPINITNTTTGASSYFWNFCAASVSTAPTGTNLGNPGSLQTPVYIDYVYDNGNYYGFSTNNFPGKLLRHDFGNSLLNTPTVTDLGTVGGVVPNHTEGLQVVKSNGHWYVIIVGGDAAGTAPEAIVKIELGPNITNNSPTGVYWGNIGNMSYPHDLYLFQDNTGEWYGLTVNTTNNTITRFHFPNHFAGFPTAVNLSNIGSLNGPTGIYAMNENGNWYAFVTNAFAPGGGTITRLDFGSSLLNVPTGTNLGNVGGLLLGVWDIHIVNSCNEKTGFAINSTNGHLIRLDFNGSITNLPTATSYGNLGNMNFPHCLSKFFRVGSDLYSFVANVNNNTFTRLRFTGCTNSSIPNSTLQTPPPITYGDPGVYNINLTIDDGLATQASTCKSVVVVPGLTHVPTQVVNICNGSGSVRLGSPHTDGDYVWNTGATSDSIDATASGVYWVETSRNGCSVRDSFVVNISPNSIPDFAFVQDMCSPNTIHFTTSLPQGLPVFWDFGNGQTNNSSPTPTVTYASFGQYLIKLKAGDGSCEDSLWKTILVDNIVDNNHVLNNDTTICLGDSILLRPNGEMGEYCWTTSPGTGLGFLTGFVKPTAPVTYYLTSQLLGNNLVVNSDFSGGNTGFISDYNYAAVNTAEGEYTVASDPSVWNGTMNNCSDHTTSSGNMMVVNGSPQANTIVWSQTITVQPNTDYAFAAWIAGANSVNPADLQFSINNINLGNQLLASATACDWQRFSISWNSGSNTSATIAIVNNNTAASGNDFLIDDIFFGTYITRTDSFTVDFAGLCDSIDINGIDRICSATDTVTYTIYRSAGCTQPFDVNVDDDFVEVVEQTNTTLKLVFRQDGQTRIKVSFPNTCKTVEDSIDVQIKFSPLPVDFGPNISTCRDTTFLLNAGIGYESYLWQDGSTGVTFQVAAPGTYHVAAQNLCGDFFRDSLIFTQHVIEQFGVNPVSALVCAGDSVWFTATGGTSYQWQPAALFENPTASSTSALINTSQQFILQIIDADCERDTVIAIPVNANPSPDINITKTNDVSCGTDTAVLIATGGLSYTWSPNLHIVRTDDDRITVKPPQIAVTYYAEGIDALGCSNKDSITVNFVNEGVQKLFVPDAFTPNGDGINDVLRPIFIGPAAKFEFSVFNRWGELVFRTKQPGVGWNGIFRSKLQPEDVYVYYIVAEGGCNGKFERKGTFILIR